MHTIKILCSAMFSNSQKFSGHFDPNSQEKSVSPTLLSFVLMLLEGPVTLETTRLHYQLRS